MDFGTVVAKGMIALKATTYVSGEVSPPSSWPELDGKGGRKGAFPIT